MSKKQITKADLEEALDSFMADNVGEEPKIKSLAILGAALLFGAIIFTIFSAGKRSGKLRSTVVEVRRS